MFDFSFVLYFYIILISILIYLYINITKHRLLISGIVSILSSSTLVLGLINYINTENSKVNELKEKKQKNYIDFISGSFDKIDNYYINNPKLLHALFYEFYGFNNFPKKYDNDNDNNNDNDNDKINHTNSNIIKNIDINNDEENNITSIEYITLLKIIQYIEIMFIINENIFEDLNFRNRIINYTNSAKFRKVLAYNKNNYSNEFLKKMDYLKIITSDEIEVENIPIPKIV